MPDSKKKPALVIMAAGMGSRYGGIKQIEPVGEYGEVILHYSIYDAVQAGFGKIVFVIRPDIEKDFKKAVIDKLPSTLDVDYVFQELDTEVPFPVKTNRTKPWGTAHAVLCSAQCVNTPFVVINADDYYGAAVFHDIFPFMQGMEVSSTSFAMAGYTLKNTLSEHGYVSRGICRTDADKKLISITEWERIEIAGGRITARHKGEDDPVFMTGTEPTSMNLFCLSPVFFGKARTAFKKFLESPEKREKEEFYLPVLLGDLLSSHDISSIEVIPTNSHWFGMTYKEDRSRVKKEFQKLIEEKVYPSPLWE